jgi:hypothetical protein
LLSSNRPSIRVNINSPQVRDYFFGSNKLVLGAKLVSSLKVFLGIVSNSRLDKYYIYYLGGVIVSINNKLIINRDIPSNEVKVPSIAESILFLNIREAGRKLSFLRK